MSMSRTIPSAATSPREADSSPKHGWKNSLYLGLSLGALAVGTFGVQTASNFLESRHDSSLPVVPISEVLRQARDQIASGANVVREIELTDMQGGLSKVSLSDLRIAGFVSQEGKVINGATSNIMKVGTWKFSGDASFTHENTTTLVVRGAELFRIGHSVNGSVPNSQQIEVIPVSIVPSHDGQLTIFSLDVVPR